MNNMKSSGAAPSGSIRRYLLLFLLILIPLLWSCVTRSIMNAWQLGETLAYFADSWRGGFWSVESDSTIYLLVLGDNGGFLGILFDLQSLVCFIAGIVLLYKTVKKRMKSLLPFAIPYFLFANLLRLAMWSDMTLGQAYGRYNIFQRWGYFIRLLHGAPAIIAYTLLVAGFVAFVWLDIKQASQSSRP